MKNTQSIRSLQARFKTNNGRARKYEFHTISSLAKRILVSRQTTYAMLERGDLQPLDRDKSGRLVFLSAGLDETRRAVVEATTSEIIRALRPLNLSEQEEAVHCLNALHELARKSKSEGDEKPVIHELGLGSAIFKAAAALGARGGAVRAATKWAIRNPTAGLAGAAAVLGGGVGAVRAATDGDSETGVLGGALKGAVGGAAVGGAGALGAGALAKTGIGGRVVGGAAQKIDAFAPKIRTAADKLGLVSPWLKRATASSGAAAATGIRKAGEAAGQISGEAPILGVGIGAAAGAMRSDRGERMNGALTGGLVGGVAGGIGSLGLRQGSRLAGAGANAIEESLKKTRGMAFSAQVDSLREKHVLTRVQAARAVRRADPEAYAGVEESRKSYNQKP